MEQEIPALRRPDRIAALADLTALLP